MESNHGYSDGMGKEVAPPLVPGEKEQEDARKHQAYGWTQKEKNPTQTKPKTQPNKKNPPDIIFQTGTSSI